MVPGLFEVLVRANKIFRINIEATKIEMLGFLQMSTIRLPNSATRRTFVAMRSMCFVSLLPQNNSVTPT
jgi:hypothetical protein